MSHSVSRRKFLQTVAATAAAAPFLHVRTGLAAPMLRHASIGASGQALSDLMSFAKHPIIRPRRRCRRRSCAIRTSAAAISQGARLPGLARAAPEGAREHRLGERLDTRPHALPGRDGGDEARQTRLCAEAAVQHDQGDAHAHRVRAPEETDDADGDPGVVDARSSATARRSSGAASSARFARCTPSRTRAGATTSRCPRARSRARAVRLGRVARGERAAAVQEGGVSPRRMAAARRLRHRHARRHGLPYLQSALSRARADVTAVGDGVRTGAERRELGDEGAREADLPGDAVHRGQDCRRLVVQRRRAAAGRRCANQSARAFPTRAASSLAPTG